MLDQAFKITVSGLENQAPQNICDDIQIVIQTMFSDTKPICNYFVFICTRSKPKTQH